MDLAIGHKDQRVAVRVIDGEAVNPGRVLVQLPLPEDAPEFCRHRFSDGFFGSRYLGSWRLGGWRGCRR
jgi:hypothetical protein